MRYSWLIVVALCGALSLGGCGGGDDGDDSGGGGTPAATESGGDPAATPESEETAAPEALAKRTVEAAGERDTTLDIEVTELAVSGELAKLVLRYTAHDPTPPEDGDVLLSDLNDVTLVEVTLVDPVNLKRYYVVEDTSGQSLQTDSVNVPIDGPAEAEYTFAAPPADVEKVDVSVGNWPTIRDVPIQR
jgi:hypothetical protein